MNPLLLIATLFTAPNLIEPSYAHSAAVQPPQQRQTQHTIAQVDESNPPLTPREVQTVAEKITVRVTSENNGGSGVLIAQKGSIYLVMTNKHVVGRNNQFKIQTPDGQKHTATLVPNTQIDPKYDIALLQFSSKQRYNLAQLENGSVLSQGREIYSLGYPFDSNRTRISIGKVTQLSDVPLDDGTQIGYKIDAKSLQIKQGMSGGPIVDGRGILLGINTIGSYPIIPSYTYFDRSKPTAKLAAKYREANWGVPVYNLLTQLSPDLLYGYDNFPKVQRQVTPTGYMAKLNRETRQQTVRIEDSCGNGSGVIVAKQGNTYYALTAKHVVETPPQETKGCPPGRHKNIKLTTYDQDSYQITSSNITVAKGLDLAIVKFTSNTNYPIAKLGKYTPIGGATVFASGYPARDKIDSPLWQWQLNPGTIEGQDQGIFQTQDRQSFSNGYDLIYGSISYGGMSGGGVFDTDGNVIGIHGRAEQTNDVLLGKSLGISIQTFIGLSTKLGVPTSLKISTKPAASLNNSDLATVIAVRDNILKPQDESSGEQWLTYGNQLYRIGKRSDAAVAFDRAIAKGQKYQLLGNYGRALALGSVDNVEALKAISIAISVVPQSDIAKYYYLWKYQSAIFRGLDRDADAMRSIDIAIGLEPNDLVLLNGKAQIFNKRKQYREAISIYDLIIIKQPDASIYYNRGNAKYDLGQKQAAITDYDRAIVINPNFAQAYNNRGNVRSNLGQKQAAIADYNQAIVINPNDAEAYSNRGNAKSDLGQKQAAIADYNRAIVINPKYANAYNNRGIVKYDLGQNQAAITDYDRAIEINPKFAKAYNNRGNARSNLGQKQAAVADYDRAIVINPNYAEAYNNRGIVKSSLGQKQAGIADYDQAIMINPNYADAYNNRGNVKSDLGQKRAAIANYNRAIEINPKFAQAYNNRGNAKSDLGQKQAAIADYDHAIMINPNYAEAYSNRGNAKSDLGQKQAAITDYDRAIEINPKFAQAYNNRGNAKSDLGQKQAAIADYDHAIMINPNLAQAYYNRGKTKYNLGQKQAAAIDLAKAAELFRQQGKMDFYEQMIRLIQKIKG